MQIKVGVLGLTHCPPSVTAGACLYPQTTLAITLIHIRPPLRGTLDFQIRLLKEDLVAEIQLGSQNHRRHCMQARYVWMVRSASLLVTQALPAKVVEVLGAQREVELFNEQDSMNKTLILVVLLSMCISCAQRAQDAALDYYLPSSLASIRDCRAQYVDYFGEDIPAEIDRVYVYSNVERLELVFARGEVGIFGPRTQDYLPFFVCGILNDATRQIYFLWEPPKTAVIDRTDFYLREAANSKYLWDLLFVEGEVGDFEFSKIKKDGD
jgi:hypothetical protein